MDMIFRKMELDDIAQIVAIEEASFQLLDCRCLSP